MHHVLVDTIPGARRLVHMTDGALTDIMIDPTDRPFIRGGIYKARVEQVIPSMRAAFLDLGDARAFLNYDAPAPVVGSDLIVQIAADSHADKIARATPRIRLVGRFGIFEPERSGGTVSQGIREKAVRQRLEAALPVNLPGRSTIRSRAGDLAPDRTAPLVTAELRRLAEIWTEIETRAQTATAPLCLHPAPSALEIAAMEWLTPEADIQVNDSALLAEVRRAMTGWAPDCPHQPRFDAQPGLFRRMGAEEAIAAMREPDVPLPGGGHLRIHETPALIAVDIDSGDARSWAPDSTADSINQAAARILPGELRRRHLGGTIAVDFIGFDTHFARALEALRAALTDDPLATRPTGVGGLGLAVFTRRRLGPSLEEVMRSLERRENSDPS